MGRDECRSCQSKREAHEAEARAQRAQAARQREQERLDREARELQKRTDDFVQACLSQMENTHSLGLTPRLVQYRIINTTFSLHSQVSGQIPNFSAYLADLTLGWEIVGMIPHTEGLALTNRTGNGNTIYAGGIGGIVSAAYVVMVLQVTPELLKQGRSYVENVLRSQYEDGISVMPAGGIPGVAPGENTASGTSTFSQVAFGAAAGMVIGSAVSDIANMGDSGGVDAGFDGGGGGGDFGDFDF